MKAKTRKIPVRPWAYDLWRDRTGRVLVTLPTDGEKLEALIDEQGELIVILAFIFFIIADPPLYHFEPVDHVDTFVTKKGNTIVTTHTDQAAITKFALALFLSKADGFLAEAWYTIEKQGQFKFFLKKNEWVADLQFVWSVMRQAKVPKRR